MVVVYLIAVVCDEVKKSDDNTCRFDEILSVMRFRKSVGWKIEGTDDYVRRIYSIFC